MFILYVFLTALLDLEILLAEHDDICGFSLDMPPDFIFQFDNCGENKVSSFKACDYTLIFALNIHLLFL